MKSRLLAVAVAVIAFAVLLGIAKVEAAAPPPPPTFSFPKIGTADLVNIYAASNVTLTLIPIWCYNTNGSEIVYGTVQIQNSSKNPYTSKAQIDSMIVAQLTTNILASFATNTSQNINRDAGIVFDVVCEETASGLISSPFFYVDSMKVYLVKNGNSYSVPSLTNFATTVNSSIPLYVPGIQWARIEGGLKGTNTPAYVADVNYDTNAIDSAGYVELPTDYISNSSSSSGIAWAKITTLRSGGAFQVWNGDGNLQAATPISVGMKNAGTNAVLSVIGGDSGQGYMVQSSSDFVHWTNGPIEFVSPVPEAIAPPAQYSWPKSSRMFFRTVTTNAVPTN